MPASLRIEDINDVVVASRPHEALGKLIDIASRLTEYPFAKYMVKNNKVTHDGGTSIRSDVMYDHNFSAAMVGLHEVIEPNIPDVLTRFDVPWRHINSHWAYERREILANAQGKTLTQIVDLMNVRRQSAVLSQMELLEGQFWTNVPDSTDERDLYGLRYWVTMTDATSTPGFNGGPATGFSDVAGLNTSTYTRWKNWNGIYVDVSEDDLLEKMAEAMDEIAFVCPMDIEEYKTGTGMQSWICVNGDTKRALEKELRARNDTHVMLGMFANTTSFRQVPLRYVPKLNADTRNPVYLKNMDYFFLAALAGDEDYEHPPMNQRDQPNTYVVHRDATMQAVCTSRRRQAVLGLSVS